MATLPKKSPARASEGTSLDCWVQIAPDRVKTYALPAWAPTAVASVGAPTIRSSPRRCTELPKVSPALPSEASSLVCWLHVDPERVKT